MIHEFCHLFGPPFNKMRHEMCTLFFGPDALWFADVHVMFLCLQFSGLADAGRRSSFFVIHTPRNHGFQP